MAFLSKYKFIIIAVLLIAIGFFAYSKLAVKDKATTTPGVRKESTGQAPATVSGKPATKSTVSDESAKAFAAQLRTLNDVVIKTDIFTDPAYTILRADNITIPPMPAGRMNPFAPVGTDGTAADGTLQATSGTGATTTPTVPVRTTRTTRTR